MGRVGRDGRVGTRTVAENVDGCLGNFECEWVLRGPFMCGFL